MTFRGRPEEKLSREREQHGGGEGPVCWQSSKEVRESGVEEAERGVGAILGCLLEPCRDVAALSEVRHLREDLSRA